MIIDTASRIIGVRCHADIDLSVVADTQARRTIPGLIHKPRLGTEYFPMCVLVLNPSEKQIGQVKPLRVLFCDSGLVSARAEYLLQ